jgi:hypothetical protein
LIAVRSFVLNQDSYDTTFQSVRFFLIIQEAITRDENRGFGALARYVAESAVRREASADRKMEMTAPLHSEVLPDQDSPDPLKRTALFMPSKFKSLSDLPPPSSDDIQLTTMPASCYAVIKFAGGVNSIRLGDNELKLKQALVKDGVKIDASDAQSKLWRYNPPWSLPFLRTNELAFKVDLMQDPLPAAPAAAAPAEAPAPPVSK